jgi:hypothetical protein
LTAFVVNAQGNTFPKDMHLKLFPLAVSSDRADSIVRSDGAFSSTKDRQDENAIWWRIERFERQENNVQALNNRHAD